MRWLMLFIASALLLGCTRSPTGSTVMELADTVRADSRMGPLIAEGYTADMHTYQGKELQELGQKYPVMYGGLEGKEIAAVQLSKGSSGKLFIYDIQKKEILREFTTQGVALN